MISVWIKKPTIKDWMIQLRAKCTTEENCRWIETQLQAIARKCIVHVHKQGFRILILWTNSTDFRFSFFMRMQAPFPSTDIGILLDFSFVCSRNQTEQIIIQMDPKILLLSITIEHPHQRIILYLCQFDATMHDGCGYGWIKMNILRRLFIENDSQSLFLWSFNLFAFSRLKWNPLKKNGDGLTKVFWLFGLFAKPPCLFVNPWQPQTMPELFDFSTCCCEKSTIWSRGNTFAMSDFWESTPRSENPFWVVGPQEKLLRRAKNKNKNKKNQTNKKKTSRRFIIKPGQLVTGVNWISLWTRVPYRSRLWWEIITHRRMLQGQREEEGGSSKEDCQIFCFHNSNCSCGVLGAKPIFVLYVHVILRPKRRLFSD